MDKTNSPEEILDLVNEQDEVVGQASRKEVHDAALLHRGVEIWIYDGQNRLLIQQRSRNKKRHPLAWTRSVGGHVPSGMNPDDAAIKELKEELGFTAPLEFIGKKLKKSKKSNRWRYTYTYKYNGEAITINRDEVEQVKFVSKDDVEQMLANGEDIGKSSLEFMMKFWSKSN